MSVKQFSIYTLFKAVDEMSAPVKNMSKNVDGLKRDMRGMDKIVKGKYTAPSGKSSEIDCENYERSVDHEADIETIPQDSKVIVEDLGLNE